MSNLRNQLIMVGAVDVALVTTWLLRLFDVIPADMTYGGISIILDLSVLILGRYIYLKNKESFKNSSYKWFVFVSAALVFLP